MRTRSLALTALALAAAVAVPAAGKSGPPTKEPDETGCRDVVSGQPRFQYLLQSIEQEEVLPPAGAALDLYRKAVVTLSDRSVATASVVLAEPSCTDVEYTIEAYDVDTRQLLASHAEKGDGASGTPDAPLLLDVAVRDYTKDTIALRVVTSSRGTVHDTAPDLGDSPVEATAHPEGTPQSGGGATSAFK